MSEARRSGVAISALLPPLAYAGLIFFLSAQSSFPMLPAGIFTYDKVIHCCEYAVLGLLVARALELYGVRHFVLLGIAAGALYGVSDELHQYFVPGRSCDPFDALADTVGSSLGAVGWLALAKRLHRFRQPRVI